MKWFKAFQIGLFILNSIAEKGTDNKISIAELIDVAVTAAEMLGYDVEDISLDLDELDAE